MQAFQGILGLLSLNRPYLCVEHMAPTSAKNSYSPQLDCALSTSSAFSLVLKTPEFDYGLFELFGKIVLAEAHSAPCTEIP